MVSHLLFYQLTLIALVWLCVMLHWAWPSDSTPCPPPPAPTPPVPKRPREPKPFAGLTTKPPCDACEHASDLRPEAPRTPPPRIVPTRGRRRVAYPRPADIVSRPLPFHLRPMDQPIMSLPNRFATPRLPLLTSI
jgi:hypothetical protein